MHDFDISGYQCRNSGTTTSCEHCPTLYGNQSCFSGCQWNIENAQNPVCMKRGMKH